MNTTIKHHVTLVKPEPNAKDFAAGERIILVDGERWGRTYVTHHGMHGTTHKFAQDPSDIILAEDRGARYPREYRVRSEKRRRSIFNNDTTWKPTEVRVQEMAQHLVDTGVLRAPRVVVAEVKESNRRYAEEQAAREKAEAEEFIAKAREAVGEIGVDTNAEELIERVVKAMRWAQEQ